MGPETRTCKACKQQFIIEAEDFGFYEKMGAPAPVNCPDCRFRWRSLFRNETSLYSRQCDLCHKNIISVHPAKTPYTVYCLECYESDKWDRAAYAQDYDAGRPFFDQLHDLMKRTPKKALYNSTATGPNINSDYTNVAGSNKNCYLIFNSSDNEETLYSRGLRNCKETSDGYFAIGLERCYETINVNQSNGVVFGQNCVSCVDCWFGMNLSGCTNCFGCVNLRNKSYHWFNEPLTKEEYERRLSEVRGSHAKMQEMRKKFEEFSLGFPRRQNNNLKSVDAVGDYLFECKNVYQCFEQFKCEDCKYGFANKSSRSSYDILGFGFESELLLDCCATGFTSRAIGTYWAEHCQNIEYSYFVRNCKDCIGCDGLKNARYCILNKQYEKDEYDQLRQKIVAELKSIDAYGMFMPPRLAPYGYNETVGQDNLPLTKDEALTLGYPWQDEIQMTTGKETLKPDQIPDQIKDVQDTILKETMACVTCSRNYRLTPSELQFYRKMSLPIPRQCFYCRHGDRLKRRGPMKIYDRDCAKCQKEVKTTYAPERPEIVYCESCYQQEVI